MKKFDLAGRKAEGTLGDVDLVLDTSGGETQQWSRTGIMVHPDPARLAARIDSGDLEPLVTAVLPLKEAARTRELSQTGPGRGKIVLRVRD